MYENILGAGGNYIKALLIHGFMPARWSYKTVLTERSHNLYTGSAEIF